MKMKIKNSKCTDLTNELYSKVLKDISIPVLIVDEDKAAYEEIVIRELVEEVPIGNNRVAYSLTSKGVAHMKES
jgi:hypothetical protein